MKRITAILLSLLMLLSALPFGVLAEEKTLIGDLDNDGITGPADATYLLNHALFGDLYPITQTVDYTKDERIDSNDAILLLQNRLLPDYYTVDGTPSVYTVNGDVSVETTFDGKVLTISLSESRDIFAFAVDFSQFLKAGYKVDNCSSSVESIYLQKIDEELGTYVSAFNNVYNRKNLITVYFEEPTEEIKATPSVNVYYYASASSARMECSETVTPEVPEIPEVPTPEDPEKPDATVGKTGDCTWTLDGTVLTISGYGAMGDYTAEATPWGNGITEIIMEDGVTAIGACAFSLCDKLTTVTIPATVRSVGEGAFSDCNSLTDVWYEGSISDKDELAIMNMNNPLNHAMWHYNTCKGGAHVYMDDKDGSCEICEWIRPGYAPDGPSPDVPGGPEVPYKEQIWLNMPASFFTELEDGSPLCYFIPENDGIYQIMTTSYETSGLVPWVRDADYNRLESVGNPYRFELKAGQEYTIAVYSYSPCMVDICVTEAAAYYVTDVKITSGPYRYEYVKGFFDDMTFDGTGLCATVTFSDGVTGIWEFPGFEPVRDEIYPTFNLDTENGILTLSCEGVEDSFSLSLIENPVDRLELVETYDNTVIFETDGYYNYEYDPELGETQRFVYYFPNLQAYQLRVHYKNGTSKLANPAILLDGYYFETMHDQDETPWKLGSDNSFTISYLGAEVEVPVTVIDNPVLGIEFVDKTPYQITENVNGYWYESSPMPEPPMPDEPVMPDEPTDPHNEMFASADRCFIYNTDSIYQSVQLKITFKDGTEKIVTPFDTVLGHYFEWMDNQYDSPWTVGTNNFTSVSYLGHTARLQIEVVENPVVDMILEEAPTATYDFGDPLYGYMPYSEEYYLYPKKLDGMKLVVEYKDGTKKTLTAADVDETWLLDGHVFNTYTGDAIYGAGEYTAYLEYMGYTFEYPVKINESPVESIEWTRAPTQTEIDLYFIASPVGAELTVTMKNGTKKVIRVTASNLEYFMDGHTMSLQFRVKDQGLTVIIDPVTYVMSPYFALNAMCYDKASEFSDYTVDRSSNVFFLLDEGFHSPEKGGKLKALDKDHNELFQVTLKDPHVEESMDMLLFYNSQRGFLTVHGDKLGERDGLTHYVLLICGQSLYVSADANAPIDGTPGDLDGDEAVTSADAIYLLYHTLFGNDRYPIAQDCDFDNDGAATSADAIYLLYHTLFGNDRYPI